MSTQNDGGVPSQAVDPDPKSAIVQQPAGLTKNEGDYRAPPVGAQLVNANGFLFEVWRQHHPITEGGGEYVGCRPLGRVPAFYLVEHAIHLTPAHELPDDFKRAVAARLQIGDAPSNEDLHVSRSELELLVARTRSLQRRATSLMWMMSFFLILGCAFLPHGMFKFAFISWAAGFGWQYFAMKVADKIRPRELLASVRAPMALEKRNVLENAKKSSPPVRLKRTFWENFGDGVG